MHSALSRVEDRSGWDQPLDDDLQNAQSPLNLLTIRHKKTLTFSNQGKNKGGRSVSNRRPPEPQSGALTN